MKFGFSDLLVPGCFYFGSCDFLLLKHNSHPKEYFGDSNPTRQEESGRNFNSAKGFSALIPATYSVTNLDATTTLVSFPWSFLFRSSNLQDKDFQLLPAQWLAGLQSHFSLQKLFKLLVIMLDSMLVYAARQ